MIKLGYVIWADVTKTKDFYTSQACSMRLRVLIPIQNFKKKYQISFIYNKDIKDNFREYFKQKKFDIVLFQKSHSLQNVEIMQYLKTLSCKVIFEVGENYYFTHPSYGDHYIQMCNEADMIVCGVKFYFDYIPKLTNKKINDIRMIDNLIEFPPNPPHCTGNHLLWFGHSSNINPLLKIMPDLKKLNKEYDFTLTVITQNSRQYADIFNQYGLNINLLEFSLDTMEQAFKICDIAILPTLPKSNGLETVKAPNRIFDAINGGMFAVADDNIASYQDLKDYCIVQKNIIDGLLWVFDNKKESNEIIALGQEYVSKKYSRKEIANQWEELFRDVLSNNR